MTSPNQIAKQQEVVRAAVHVLTTQGLAACTARGIAAASPLTKSAIHYYFADTADLVDRAMAAHVADVEGQISGAPTPAEPLAAFWTAVDAYLAAFTPPVAQLWFEYWVATARAGRSFAGLHEQVTRLLADRLQAAGDLTPTRTATSVFVFLVGAVLEQTVDERSIEDVRARVARMTGLAPPRR